MTVMIGAAMTAGMIKDGTITAGIVGKGVHTILMDIGITRHGTARRDIECGTTVTITRVPTEVRRLF